MAEHKTRPVDDPDNRDRVEVVIDVKPRGDFSKVAEPKYYKLVTPSEKGCRSLTTSSISKFLYMSATKDESKTTSAALEVGADYTIRVYIGDTTAASGSWGVVGVYDTDMNLLWSYLVCSYMEGHPVKDIYYTSDIAVMDRWLGHPTGTAACAEAGSFKANREPQKENGGYFTGEVPYFQWGRKDPFPVENEGGLTMYSVQLATDDTTIEDGIKNPTVHYGYSAGTTVYDTKGDWHCEGVRNDLWGGYNNTEKDWCDDKAVGHKTVFDPCPAGYRVPDARVLKHVTEKGEIWETIIQNEPLQDETYINKQSPFYKDDGGTSVIAVKDVNGEYDYWSFAGYRGCGSKYGEGTSNNRNKGLMAWANSISSAETGQGRAVNMEYTYWSDKRHFNSRHTSRRAYRYPVRCQKIID